MAKGEQVVVRFQPELLAWIDGHRQGGESRAGLVRRCVERVQLASQPAPGQTPVVAEPRRSGTVRRPAETPSVEVLGEIVERRSGCAHPRAQRQNLGYAIKCGLCGKMGLDG